MAARARCRSEIALSRLTPREGATRVPRSVRPVLPLEPPLVVDQVLLRLGVLEQLVVEGGAKQPGGPRVGRRVERRRLVAADVRTVAQLLGERVDHLEG